MIEQTMGDNNPVVQLRPYFKSRILNQWVRSLRTHNEVMELILGGVEDGGNLPCFPQRKKKIVIARQ